MAVVCPSVTCSTDDVHEYRNQMERIEFAERIQVDLMDGDFTPARSPNIDKIWFLEDKLIDLHLMYRYPADVLNDVLELRPQLLIVHAEAEFDLPTLAEALKAADIKVGLALLQETEPRDILDELEYVDHVLIFSGTLGYFGGTADLKLLRKVEQLKRYKPSLEIGWDGGVNEHNAVELANGGVDVLNVGGFIQKADDPQKQYRLLSDLLQS